MCAPFTTMCSIINIECQNDDKLCYSQKQCRDDVDFFTNLPMDDTNLMMVDEFIDIIKNEPDLEKANINGNHALACDTSIMYDSAGDLKSSFGNLSVKNEITDTMIDPNEFLNDMYKTEMDYSSTFSSPSYRSTPSPTTSNSSERSSDQLSIDFNSASNQSSEASINVYNSTFSSNVTQFMQSNFIAKQQNYPLDTPPISPPTDTAVGQKMSYIQSSSQIAQSLPMITTADDNQAFKIIQGTLIPITAVSLSTRKNCTNNINTHNLQSKKVKIQPKPLATITTKSNSISAQTLPTVIKAAASVNGTTQLAPKIIQTPKRIVLSGDYKPLVLKTNTQKSTVTADNVTTIPKTIQTNDTNIVKLISTNTTTSNASIVNTSATLKLNTQPLISTGNRIQIAPLNHNKKQKPKSIQDEIDERTIKKQMRMIKNRESACLSRKKKKEYVNTLECRLNDLNKENQELRSENMALKERLGQVASKICDMCGNLMTEKSGKHDMDTMTMLRNLPKKNAAFLLAFVFMVSLNVGPFISSSGSSNLAAYSDNDKLLAVPPSHHQIGTRGLLWIDDESGVDTTNASHDDSTDTKRTYPMCPVSVNQSESIRLASELKRWIGNLPEYFNLTKKIASNNEFDLSKINDFLLLEKENAVIKSFYEQMNDVRQLRKLANDIEMDKETRKRATINRKMNNFKVKKSSIDGNDNDKHVQIFNPAYSNAIKYATFFEEIHRQDDTFYVVSFHADHLLLPALAHNKTFRPKMSVMLPAWNLNNNNNASTNGIVTLMQIDCEVLNTSMIHIKESSIPDNLRNRSSTTTTTTTSSSSSSSSSSTIPTKNTTDSTMENEPLKPRNMKLRHRRNRISTTRETDELPTDSIITTGSNNSDINNGFKSENFVGNEYDKKIDTVKNYKPYFLRNRIERTQNIGN